MAIPEERIVRMQRRLSRVWHRFAYTRGKVGPVWQRLHTFHTVFVHTDIFTHVMPTLMHVQTVRAYVEASHKKNVGKLAEEWRGGGARLKTPMPPVTSYPHEDDAFGTIMQWLYARIPATRGGRKAKGAAAAA